MSASSVLGIIGASLALADAVLSPMTNTTTKTTQPQSNTRSSYSQPAARTTTTTTTKPTTQQNFNPNNYYSTTKFQPPTTAVTTGTQPIQPQPTQIQPQPIQPQPTTTPTVTPIHPDAIAPQQTVAQNTTKTPTPPPPPKKELSEEEKFLTDFLPTLYSGDRDAIKKNTDGCESDDDLSDLIIEDLMRFSEKAQAHQGYSSAKILSKGTQGNHTAITATVTFKDESTSQETFNVIKRPEEPWKYYVE